MKKFLALLLALVMVMGLATTAFAADNDYTITIKNASKGETYKIYKMMDLTVNDPANPTSFTYTITDDFKDFFDMDGADFFTVTVGAERYITGIKNVEEMAQAAAKYVEEQRIDEITNIIADSTEIVVFGNLEPGYYLITSTLGTIAMTDTTPDKVNVEITEKNQEPTIEKEVKEDDTFGENNDAQIGDKVEFQSTVTIVKGARNVKVHDKMTTGLTFNNDIAIAGLTQGKDYTVTTSASDGCTFEIYFHQAFVDTITVTTEYVITYSATLNKNAANGAIVNQTNQTKVTYGDISGSEWDSTITITHFFNVFKHAKGSTDNLAGAKFQLKKNGNIVPLIKINDNNYRVAEANETGATDTFVTVSSGDIVIWGVDTDGAYTLKETEPPAGYNQLKEEVAVTVDADNATRVDVENNAGTELPSTGGMGTTMFYIFGGTMMMAAVVLLVTKKRMADAV